MRSATLAFCLAAVVAGCTEPLEFADWRLPIPEGTPIREYAPVPLDERNVDTIRLIDDLVIGDESDDQRALLYRPRSVVAADDGIIYVADAGSDGIHMFGVDGDHLRTVGRDGEGPGEFRGLLDMTVAGDRLLAYDARLRRMSVWTLGGEYLEDRSLGSSEVLMAIQGLGDGSFVSNFTVMIEPRSVQVARHPVDAPELTSLIEMASPPPLVIRDGQMTAAHIVREGIKTLDYPRLAHTVGAQTTVYVSPIHEYQVLAFSGSGEAEWALRVAWSRPPLSDDAKERRVERAMRSGTGGTSAGDFEWPPDVAVEAIRTDGAGNLWVFPKVLVEGEEPPELLPVDVYSPEGDFIAAGLVPQMWSYARGDYVYGLRRDEREETVVVRSRLVLPSEE